MNFIKIALLFSFLIFAGTAHAEECPKAKDSLQNLTGAAAAILKQTQIDAVKKDPRDFCQRNMLLRGLNANGAAPADVAKISTEDLKKDYAGKISAHSPWDLTLIPTKETRSSGVKELSDIFPNLQSEFSSPHHEKSLNCPPDSLPFSEIKGSPPICKTMPATKIPDVGNAKKFVACAEVSIWNSRGCATGLSILEKEMAPHGDQSLTFMPLSLWNRVLGQSKYDEGLRLATLTIMNRANGTSLDKNANIFSDLQNAFRKSGLSIKESTDASFDILGLIGSASSNLATRIGALGVLNQKTKALISIATALPYLDYMKSTEGKASLYSLPASVVSSCDNAKTYHFWMAAYLARMLANKNDIGPDGIAAAVFVAEKGYQVSRNITNDRAGSASSIITKMPYDPVHQVQRMDLNFAAAGAEFGARSLTTDTKLNLDQSLVSMIENSKVTPPVSKEEAKGMGLISTYLKWEKEVSPNTALDAVEKQLP